MSDDWPANVTASTKYFYERIDALHAENKELKTLITQLSDALDITTQLLHISDIPDNVVNNKVSENKILHQLAREVTKPNE